MTIKNQLKVDDDILIVDDSIHNLRFLKDLLNDAGYRVRPATDGKLALRAVQMKQPALILLDVRMPIMDGFEVCKRLKENESTCDIPIIFVTALSETSEKVKGFELGAVDYITKPLDAQEVLIRVNNHLALAQTRLQLKIQNQQLCETIAKLEFINRELEETKEKLARYSHNLENEVALRTQSLIEANNLLKDLSEHDELTGIANRRKFDKTWEYEWRHAWRLKNSLSIIMIDIDHFKEYNDYYGHLAGDDCLKKVACAMVSKVKRCTDLVARYGGEEFAVIITGNTEKNAKEMAESIRKAVEELNITHIHNTASCVVTISLGLAFWSSDILVSPENLLHEADNNLYRAKREGRNRVCFS